MNSIHPAKRNSQPSYETIEDILKGVCPTCGYTLDLTRRHIGGLGMVPFVRCSNLDGGETTEHVLVRIPKRLARAYWDCVEEAEWAEAE